MKLQPMKAMKLQPMKAMKVQKKQGKLTKKDLENLPQGELSLKEKIQTFKKSANPDMASVSPAQRQVLWKRFEYARQEEPEAQSAWTTACRGAGSTQIKQDLLALYPKSDSANKKSQMWFRKLVEHAHVTGSKTTTVWEPFVAIKAHYGIQELMRRVARGTILCRRASDDKAEWEFRKITKEEYETEEVEQQTTGQKQQSMLEADWRQLLSKHQVGKPAIDDLVKNLPNAEKKAIKRLDLPAIKDVEENAEEEEDFQTDGEDEQEDKDDQDQASCRKAPADDEAPHAGPGGAWAEEDPGAELPHCQVEGHDQEGAQHGHPQDYFD